MRFDMRCKGKGYILGIIVISFVFVGIIFGFTYIFDLIPSGSFSASSPAFKWWAFPTVLATVIASIALLLIVATILESVQIGEEDEKQ